MSNSSKSESTPLNGQQRSDIFRSALDSLGKGGGYSDTLKSLKYEQPEYQEAAPARTLSGGDYDNLQASMYKGATSGLDQAWKTRTGEINQSMADRGLWASGAAEKALQDDYAKNWVPAYEKAGSDAVQGRYNIQNNENQSLNGYDLARAQARNTWGADQANQRYQAQWRPADYLAGVWNGTGGAVSSGNASGWSI